MWNWLKFMWIKEKIYKRKKRRNLKKNNDPSGSITRLSDGINGVPLWNHDISGVGLPVALQFKVNGSSRAAIASAGCSNILGRCCALKKFIAKIILLFKHYGKVNDFLFAFFLSRFSGIFP